jgi:hypothetical protein
MIEEFPHFVEFAIQRAPCIFQFHDRSPKLMRRILAKLRVAHK